MRRVAMAIAAVLVLAMGVALFAAVESHLMDTRAVLPEQNVIERRALRRALRHGGYTCPTSGWPEMLAGVNAGF